MGITVIVNCSNQETKNKRKKKNKSFLDTRARDSSQQVTPDRNRLHPPATMQTLASCAWHHLSALRFQTAPTEVTRRPENFRTILNPVQTGPKIRLNQSFDKLYSNKQNIPIAVKLLSGVTMQAALKVSYRGWHPTWIKAGVSLAV